MISRFYLIIAFLLFASFASAQNAILKGRITDGASNEPLPGAYIHFDGLNKGAISDAFGNFEFDKLSPGAYKIKVKYVGFEEFEKEINISSGQVVILNIPLAEKKKELNGVNVYGKLNESNESSSRQSEKNANNITNVISARAMERSPTLMQRLH